jgi:hypothetical protein
LLPSCPGWLVAQMAAARRSVQPASSGRALSPWSARPGHLPRRRSPVRVHHVVSTQRFRRPVRPSSVQPRLVSSASGVHPSGVHPSGVHPSGVHPSSVQPAAVRPGRSGRVHLVLPWAVALGTRSLRRAAVTTGTGRVPAGCHAVERPGRPPGRPGRGRCCRGRALSVGSVADPGRVGCGRGRA